MGAVFRTRKPWGSVFRSYEAGLKRREEMESQFVAALTDIWGVPAEAIEKALVLERRDGSQYFAGWLPKSQVDIDGWDFDALRVMYVPAPGSAQAAWMDALPMVPSGLDCLRGNMRLHVIQGRRVYVPGVEGVVSAGVVRVFWGDGLDVSAVEGTFYNESEWVRES